MLSRWKISSKSKYIFWELKLFLVSIFFTKGPGFQGCKEDTSMFNPEKYLKNDASMYLDIFQLIL